MNRKDSKSNSRSGKNHYSRSKSKSQSYSKSRSKSRRSNSISNKGNVLYVSNLSSRVKERHLEEKFGKYGEIDEVQLIKDPYTRESRGFAFVYFASVRSAEEAIRKLNGADIEGRTLRVEKSKRNRPREQTPGRYVGRASGRSKNFKMSRSRSRSRSRSPYYRSFHRYRRSRSPRKKYRSRSFSGSRSRSKSRRKKRSRSRSRS